MGEVEQEKCSGLFQLWDSLALNVYKGVSHFHFSFVATFGVKEDSSAISKLSYDEGHNKLN